MLETHIQGSTHQDIKREREREQYNKLVKIKIAYVKRFCQIKKYNKKRFNQSMPSMCKSQSLQLIQLIWQQDKKAILPLRSAPWDLKTLSREKAENHRDSYISVAVWCKGRLGNTVVY